MDPLPLDTPVSPAAGEPARPATPAEPPLRVDRDHLSWAATHEREVRRHGADLAQITTHHDRDGARDAIGQQQAWARRHAHERHLRDSAIVQLRQQKGPDPWRDPAR